MVRNVYLARTLCVALVMPLAAMVTIVMEAFVTRYLNRILPSPPMPKHVTSCPKSFFFDVGLNRPGTKAMLPGRKGPINEWAQEALLDCPVLR